MGVITITAAAKANVPPVANAGPDGSINQPSSTTNLNGSASADPDGSIVAYLWTKTSGPSCTIVTPTSATTSVTGMTTVGTYTFQLRVTDNLGATATDSVTIIVNALPTYSPKWVVVTPGTCVHSVYGYNTGYAQFATLKKVSNDVNQYPLDVNNNRTADTGLAQATKANVNSDPDYIAPVSDTADCPVPGIHAWNLSAQYGLTIVGVTGTNLPAGIDTANVTTNNNYFDSIRDSAAQTISISVTGTGPVGLSLKIDVIINGTFLPCIAYPHGGSYNIAIPALTPNDNVAITIDSGTC